MDGGTLSVIDVPARRVIRTIDLGADSATHGISFLGDSVVAVTSRATQSTVLVNVLRDSILGSAATAGGHPHMLTAVANGSRFYTSEADSRTISEFDATARTLAKTFRLANAPEGMVVTPDGSEVWIGTSTFLTGQVVVLDPKSGAVTTVARMFGWPYRLHLTPDAGTVLVPDMRRGTLRVIDRLSRRELGRVRYGGGEPGGLAITPDGRYAFQTLMQQARVAIVDIARREIVGNLHVGETPDGIAYTPRVFPAAP
jgi:DNA-binding beta-propeller fold protein YncE